MSLRAGGYQGSASILTAAMNQLCAALRQHDGIWSELNFTANVTTAGETAAALFDSVERDQRQLCYLASGYISHRVPELQILDLPFTHMNRPAFFQSLDGEGGQNIKSAVTRQTGFEVLAFWDNGVRHITNAVRPIHAPADARGVSVRTLDSALYRASLNAMGFDARTCDVKDLVAWVSEGVVQAQENPLTNYLGFELWRHHPHVSLTGHFQGVLLLVCPARWHQQLPAQAQDQLHQAVARVTQAQRLAAVAEDQRALTRMRELGIAWLEPQYIDLAAFERSVHGSLMGPSFLMAPC